MSVSPDPTTRGSAAWPGPTVETTFTDNLCDHVLDFHHADETIRLAGVSLNEVASAHDRAHIDAHDYKGHRHDPT